MNECGAAPAPEERPYYQSYNGAHNNAARYNSPPQPPRRKSRLWLWILLAVILVAAVIGWAAWTAAKGDIDPGARVRGSNIAVLSVYGSMSIYNDAAFNDGYDHEFLLDTIAGLIEDPSNEALLLCVDSGGGEVIAAEELSQAVLEYKELTGRPVYAYGYTTDASAAYWVSCAADQIWLNRYCTTGSIGVTYGTMFDLSGLLEKYGIKTHTITSGAQKSMGSSFEEMTEETRAIFQSFIDEYYGYFVDFVSEQRGMEREKVLALADGRVYTATQAVANGLADFVGDYDDCLNALIEDNGLEFCSLQEYAPPVEENLLSQLLGSTENTELALLLQMLPSTGPLSVYGKQ